jgi:N-acyl-D-amino-acid deacylase
VTEPIFDLIIDGATIYDGSGKPPYTGSVGVKNNLIAAVEPTLSAHQAKTRIAGKGLCLMPGIIDSHTHYDAQITWDPYLAQSVQMGVTTALIGNCGFTKTLPKLKACHLIV